MRKSIILGSGLVLAVVLSSTVALAQRPGGPGRGGPGPGVNAPGRDVGFLGPIRQIDLTQEQRTKVREIVNVARDEAQPIRKELRDTTRDLRAALLANDSARAGELSAKTSTLRQQIADIHLKASTSFAALLTDEQKDKLTAARENRPGPRPRPRRVGRGGARST